MECYSKDYNHEWALRTFAAVHDFPALCELHNALVDFLAKGAIFSTRNRFMEDFYELSSYDSFDDNTYYNLIIGGKIYNECNHMIQSSEILGLTHSDIEAFYECVDAFIKDAMLNYSRVENRRYQFNMGNKTIKDGKLYVIEHECYDEDTLENIYCAGDRWESIDCYVEVNGQIVQKIFRDIAIDYFDDIHMTVIATDGRVFDLTKIAFISNEEPTNKLTYNAEEIADDFFMILSDDEKEEFRTKSIDDLFYKYCWTIINRTWMCRTEHNFTNHYPELVHVEDDGNHSRVFKVVKWVIKMLKDMCEYR
jgi:hypothetical protein